MRKQINLQKFENINHVFTQTIFYKKYTSEKCITKMET
jgi:hypothetical protein